MKRITPITLIAATLAAPCASMAGAFSHLFPLHESRKLVDANRVDRVSTNADWIRMECPAATSPESANFAPALTSGETPTSAEDFAFPAPEPVAVIASSRVIASRPTGDSRFPGRRDLPS